MRKESYYFEKGRGGDGYMVWCGRIIIMNILKGWEIKKDMILRFIMN